MEVSRMRSVPTEDRVWVLLRPEVLGKRGLCRVVGAIADRAVRWLSGDDRTESAALEAAARAAVWAWSAEEAAWAWSAAASVAKAARAAEAAWARAAASASVDECRWQLARIRKELT
jgi:hypothetical protein